MKSLLGLTLVFIVVIVIISLPLKQMKFLVPLIFILFSIILFIISTIVGQWEGMQLGVISASLFIVSPVSLILIFVLQQLKFKK
ncbi:hypothetical protein GT022_06875 [Agaribacter marinus]|uniref:YesK-like protein n=1 Tax=Virgibacillus salarius TaxID=447199 RepID=A0A941I8M4_9BACI|nr:hypothetical protein [Virgibacillus salarius]NAZ08482.1 hypothetical protein [Agaribacter marinus]